MGKFLPFPSLCRSAKLQESDQSIAPEPGLRSSNPSLTSEPSLQSVPSLTPPAHPPSAHHCLATFKAHHSHIFSLTLSNNHLYSGDSNGQVRLWDRYPSPNNSYNGHTVLEGYGAVKCIVILGDKMFTAHQDHKIRVWNIDNCFPEQKYRLNASLPTFNDRCARLLYSKNYVKVSKHKKRTWVHHNDAVSALALSSDGSVLYSVSWDRTIKVWRTADFKCMESVHGAHDDAINAIVVSNDGHLYTGSADTKIKVWKKQDEGKKLSLVSTLQKHKSAVNALALSSDGSILYSGACDRSIVVWEKDDGGAAHMVVAGALRGHTKAILCLNVVEDLLCSGSADQTVRIWRGNGKSYCCLAVFEGHTSPVKCLAAALDKSRDDFDELGNCCLIYSGSLDFDMKVWQIWVPFS